MGRRVSKVTEDGSGTTECDYVYDGWALIRERIASGETAQTNSYVYGLDLSGSLQGAGTIGGILATVREGDSAPVVGYYAYDANGNVTDLVGTNGTVLARYEYDPFGNPLVATGALAAANPFRFSTKYTDDETGLVYYGYRYYSPEMGRWLSRDPIGERGGLNLFCIAANAPIDVIDVLGMSIFENIGMSIGGYFKRWQNREFPNGLDKESADRFWNSAFPDGGCIGLVRLALGIDDSSVIPPMQDCYSNLSSAKKRANELVCCDESTGVKRKPVLFAVGFDSRPGEVYPEANPPPQTADRLAPIDEEAWRNSHQWPNAHHAHGDGRLTTYTKVSFFTYTESNGKWATMTSNQGKYVWFRSEKTMLNNLDAYNTKFFCVACPK
jgi:RHS repeat-associated protein